MNSKNEDIKQVIFETMPIGLDIVDEEGNILFMNKLFSDIFGKKAIGKKCYKTYKDDKKQCDDCPLKLGVEVGKTNNLITSGVADHKIFQISHTGIIYKGKNGFTSFGKVFCNSKICSTGITYF